MITNVTTAWKSTFGCFQTINRLGLLPETFIKIEYDQSDAVAQACVDSITATQAETWSDTDDIMDLTITYDDSYASLEPNAWQLNGEIDFYVSSDDVGFVSSVTSDESRDFITKPVITLTWATEQTYLTGGLDIVWSSIFGEYATNFTVKEYLNNALVAQSVISNNQSVHGFAEIELQHYDKIEITIDKWSVPLHRARIESITIGQYYILTKDKVMGMTHVMSSDILSLSLPDEHITFDIPNINQEWNPDNPHGKYRYLLQRQKVTVSYGIKISGSIEWIKVATYYLSEWDIPLKGLTASFTARSLTDFMTNKYQVPSPAPTTLRALAQSAFGQANLPTNDDSTNKWNVDNLPQTAIDITQIDFNHTCAEVVQLCANAGKCIIKSNVDGDVYLKPIDTTLTDYFIDRFVSYDDTQYTITQDLYAVDINNGLNPTVIYSSEGETQQINNDLIQSANQATQVSAWIAEYLAKRKTISGEYRPDVRLEQLDLIKIQNKYATNTVYITSIEYEYNGTFRGKYEGKVMSYVPNETLEGLWYAGEIYSGDNGGWG